MSKVQISIQIRIRILDKNLGSGSATLLCDTLNSHTMYIEGEPPFEAQKVKQFTLYSFLASCVAKPRLAPNLI